MNLTTSGTAGEPEAKEIVTRLALVNIGYMEEHPAQQPTARA